jgi:hypothetical protein
MTGAQRSSVLDLLTSDGAILVFTACGIVATAASIVRDARRQRARVVAEEVEVPVEIRPAA